MKKRGLMFLAGMFLLSLAVILTGCGGGGSSNSETGGSTNVTISGTVVYSPDSGPDVMLQGITVEARNPSDDSVIATTTTDANGAYSVSVPANQDFYLHATGKTIGSTTYVSDNLQIENEAADKTVNFWLIDTGTLNMVATAVGIDTTNDAIFAMGVEDSNGTGIAGVSVSPSPAVSNIWYHQLDDSLSPTGPTTTAGEPSVIGNVSSPGANGTYTFTLSPDQATAGYTIDTTFRLRLIPSEISEPIESDTGGGSTSTYTIGGTVSGLVSGETVVLQNNAGDDLTITANGSFTFATALADGMAYNVQVTISPSGKTCTASNNSGTISGANVTSVIVTCSANSYTIGGNVTGLPSGESVVLRNNGGDDLTVAADGIFTFATAIADSAGYSVTVKTQPKTASCTVTNGSGTVSGVNVTNVAVTCTSVTISGTVVYSPDTGPDVPLAGIPIEARNPSDDSVINSTTTDTAGAYSVTVPPNQDFYLHATGTTIGSTTYVSENLQIENETADRPAINIYMIDDVMVGQVAGVIGGNATTDAIFAMDVEDGSSTGIAGVTVSASPPITNIWYNQDGTGSNFSITPPTTVNNGPSVVGYVSAPGSNGTYTFNMTGSTSGMTIDNPFRLRLIPGEISEPIEP
ncbi:hypothetical protein BMS3Abin07_00470 [bacterium BMS3Abin07]|nr:hypothetical protein BMS3Abin07_00470 [bacterium BMS3Abin07]